MITIGTETFSSKAAAKAFITRFLVKPYDKEDIESASYWIYPLFELHPSWKLRSRDMKHIGIRGGSFVVVKNSGRVTPISFAPCLHPPNPLSIALRTARDEIKIQIRKFRRQSTNRCELCNVSSATKFHVDHVTHFKTLFCDWMTERGVGVQDLVSRVKGKRRQFINTALGFRWKEYHAKHATLRMLCSDCNLRRAKKV